MPKTYQLANQRQQSGGNTKLGSVLFDDNIASNLRPAIINPNAANMQYTPQPIPEIVIDTTLDSAAKAAQSMTTAAFRLQEQQAQADADKSVLELQQQFNARFREYESTMGENAAKGYQPFADSINQVSADMLEQLPPSARAKAVNRVHQLRNTSLNQGAAHSSKQLKVWQGNILQAQENQVVNDVSKAYMDPVAVVAGYNAQMDSIADHYAGREDYIKVKQQGFKDNLFKSLINTSITSQAFDLANNYIEGGKEEGVDSDILSAGFAKLEGAIYTADRRYEAKLAKDAAIQKKNSEAEAQKYGNLALSTGQDAYLSEIKDLKLRKDMMTTIGTIRSKSVTTIPAAKTAMYARRDELANNPGMVLNGKAFPNISGDDRITFYNQLISDRKQGLTQLRKQTDEWIESFMPKHIMGGIAQRSQDPGDIAMHQSLTNIMNNAIDTAKAEGRDPEMAVFDAKAKIMQSPTFKEDFSNMKINRQHLIRLDNVQNMQDFEDDLMTTYDPKEAEAKLKDYYGKASKSVLKKYEIPPDFFDRPGASYMDAIQYLAGQPGALKNFMRDSQQVLLQNRYFRSAVKNNQATSNDASFTPQGL